MILSRQITKELIITTLSLLLVLLLVASSNEWVKLITKAAMGQFPLLFAIKLSVMSLPELVALLTPISVFLAILIVHGRWHVDSEFTALLACGVSWGKITWITVRVAVLIAVLIAILTLWVIPSAQKGREQLLVRGEALGGLRTISPGRFVTLANGKLTFYVDSIDEYDNIKKIFLVKQAPDNLFKYTVTTAKTAQLDNLATQNGYHLVLYDGRSLTGVTGEVDCTITDFSQYGQRLLLAARPIENYDRFIKTSHLMRSNHPDYMAELQWRIALPIMVIVLALIAVPFGQLKPRSGRFNKCIPGILFVIIYYNLVILGKRWIARQVFTSMLSVAWIHLFFVLLGLYMLGIVSGRYVQLFAWLKRK